MARSTCNAVWSNSPETPISRHLTTIKPTDRVGNQFCCSSLQFLCMFVQLQFL